MKRIMFFLLLVALFAGCQKKDNEVEKGALVVGLTIPNDNPMTGQSYIKVVGALEGQTVTPEGAYPAGWGTSIMRNGNDIFTLPDFMGTGASVITRYTMKDGELTKTGEISIPIGAGASTIMFHGGKAFCNLFSLGKIFIFDPVTLKEIKTIDLAPWANPTGVDAQGKPVVDNNPDPGAMVVRDGKLYVGLDQVNAQWMPTSKTAEVGIIDLKDYSLVKKITCSVDGLCFATRPIDPKTMFMDDNGDIYIACIGGFGMMPGYVSGFLRIKAGSDEFDPDYKFVVQGMSFEGREFTWIERVLPIGGSEAIIYGHVPSRAPDDKTGMMGIATDCFRVNLAQKKIEYIKEIPTTRSHSVCLGYTYDNKVFVGTATKSGNTIAIYDPATKKYDPTPVLRLSAMPIDIFDFRK